MTQSDDDLKATILARRARFIALALSASGLSAASLVACGGKTTDNSEETQPVQSTDPTNDGTPPQPTACLSIAADPTATMTTTAPTATPTVCLSPLPPDVPTTSPTPCLSIAPDPMVCLGATYEPPDPPVPVDAGPGPIPEPTVCLTPIFVPVPIDAGAADGGVDGGTMSDASVQPVPTPCLSIALPLDAGTAVTAADDTVNDDTGGAGGAGSGPQGSGGTN